MEVATPHPFYYYYQETRPLMPYRLVDEVLQSTRPQCANAPTPRTDSLRPPERESESWLVYTS